MHGTFDALLRELSVTRTRYETLRSQGDDYTAAAEAISQLHALRATIAQVRSSL